MSRKDIVDRAKKYNEVEDQDDALREMTEYENDLMKKFETNDQEIDDMLDEVINQIDGLKIHA